MGMYRLDQADNKLQDGTIRDGKKLICFTSRDRLAIHTSLDISNCSNLTEIGTGWLGQFTVLTTLSLSSCGLTDSAVYTLVSHTISLTNSWT